MNRNHVVAAITVHVTDLVSGSDPPVTVVQLVFTARSSPAEAPRVWPTLVLPPSVANELLQSLTKALAVVRASEADRSGSSH